MRNRVEVLNLLPKNSIGCEIGVWKGEFAEQLVLALNPKKLYLVDPWLFMGEYPDRWYGGTAAKSQNDMDEIEANVRFKFRKFDEMVEVHKTTFDQFILQNKDIKLDWVYVDGNHSYDYVLKDLYNSLSVLAKPGIIAGDDYDAPEVKRAVNEFVEKHNFKFHIIDGTQYIIAVK